MAQTAPVPLLGAVHVHAGGSAVAVTTTVAVPLERPFGVDHRRPVVAVEEAMPGSLFATAREDAGRAIDAVKAPGSVAPFRHPLPPSRGSTPTRLGIG